MFEEESIEEFEAQTHVLLGIPTCAHCGRPQPSSTTFCFYCVEEALQGDQPLAPIIKDRSAFYQRLAQAGAPNPEAQAKVVRVG